MYMVPKTILLTIIGCLIFTTGVAVVSGIAALKYSTVVKDLEEEQAERIKESKEFRSQDCAINEAKQLMDIRQLKSTYDALIKLPVEEENTFIIRAVVGALPRTEGEAAEDDAPSFCDRPGYGLPEKGKKGEKKTPKRPPEIEALARRVKVRLPPPPPPPKPVVSVRPRVTPNP
jgi:hypothetical protein